MSDDHAACEDCARVGRSFCDCDTPCPRCVALTAAIDRAADVLHSSWNGTRADLARAIGEARRGLREVVPAPSKATGQDNGNSNQEGKA